MQKSIKPGNHEVCTTNFVGGSELGQYRVCGICGELVEDHDLRPIRIACDQKAVRRNAVSGHELAIGRSVGAALLAGATGYPPSVRSLAAEEESLLWLDDMSEDSP